MPIFPNRVSEIAGVTGFGKGANFKTASPGGPAGSSLMTFFCVATLLRASAGTDYLFQRFMVGGAADGWGILYEGNTIRVFAANATPAEVSASRAVSVSMHKTPLIIVARYNGVPNPGNIQGWVNGVSTGVTPLGTGYSSAANFTAVGIDGAQIRFSPNIIIHEAGMLDGYDCAATIATLNAQWTEDLQQGRPLTWPRAAVAGSDWYWSARDAALGLGGCVPTWTDRYSGVAMTRTGTPQSASVPGRLA